MRKETCTYNELGRFPDGLGYWKAHRTQHTEKCKGKSLSPTISLPKYNEAVQNDNIITGITVIRSTTALGHNYDNS